MTLYTYLPPDQDQVRLIRLLAAVSWDKQLQISLFPASLSDPDRQDHQALSYVWGDPQQTIGIVVNNDYVLEITTDLTDLLRQLRRDDSDRILWVDAISINQKDNNEKSHQVGRMDEIYRRASFVVAWRGTDYWMKTRSSE